MNEKSRRAAAIVLLLLEALIVALIVIIILAVIYQKWIVLGIASLALIFFIRWLTKI